MIRGLSTPAALRSEFVIFLLPGIAISGEKWMMEGGGGVVMDEEVRLREPNRKQLLLQQVDYEALIDAEHPARSIWRVLEGLDLSRFCAPIKARENSPGRDATFRRGCCWGCGCTGSAKG